MSVTARPVYVLLAIMEQATNKAKHQLQIGIYLGVY